MMANICLKKFEITVLMFIFSRDFIHKIILIKTYAKVNPYFLRDSVNFMLINLLVELY